MKTATITLHSAHNNGSYLQSFALQTYITNLGYDNQILNYVPQAQKQLYERIVFKDFTYKGIIKGCLNIPNYNSLKIRRDRFQNLISGFNLTNEINDEHNFRDVTERFDILIAGSDQIWNNASMPDFSRYFLLPTNNYKISYAPSFGKSLEHQFDDMSIIDSISQFNKISVREKSAKTELEKYITNKNVDVVLDPTFLLNSEDYNGLINSAHPKYKGDFIFFYCIKASREVLETVKEIGKTLKLPIVTVFTGVNSYKCQYFGQQVDFAAGPEEFLYYIKNAKYVLSNSFHGLVFSIIFNKIFYRIADIDNNKLKIDERLDSILNYLNLDSQNIIAGEKPILYNIPNFDIANSNLSELKRASENWLINALNPEK